MNEFTLTIKGFKNAQQVEEFALWYSEQGEQDACYWFDARCSEGSLDVDNMPVDSHKMQGNWDCSESGNLDLVLEIS